MASTAWVHEREARAGEPNIVPEAQRAPLLSKAFEIFSTGLEKKTAVLETVTEMGLRTRRNKPLSPQTFDAMLRKPVYCGWVCPPSANDLRTKGLHQPLISEDLFERVQRILDGKKPAPIVRQKLNPNLPLKCFVKCFACCTPLTGGFPKGRTNKYPRYWCRKSGCRSVGISKESVEREFLLLLHRLQPDKSIIGSFPKIVALRCGRRDREMRRNKPSGWMPN